MTILFDLSCTQPNISGKRHGGGKYAEVVLLRMLERDIPLSCVYDSCKWLNPDIAAACRSHDVPLFDLSAKSISQIVRENNIKLFYSSLLGQMTHIPECQIVTTVHGFRFLETPFDWFTQAQSHRHTGYLSAVRYWLHLRRIKDYQRHREAYLNLLNAPNVHIVTVSQHTKNSLYAFFPECRSREVPVFYSPSTSYPVSAVQIAGRDRYYLLVSANRPEKNNLRALIALDQLFDEGSLGSSYVMVTGCRDIHCRYRLKHRDRFRFLGYVDEPALNELYANAYAFLYPSLNEGFGYPPMEAMRYGVPVLASGISAIPEVCGDAALYFCPFLIHEMKNRILMLENEKIHAQMSSRAMLRYQYISNIQKRDLDLLVDYIVTQSGKMNG